MPSKINSNELVNRAREHVAHRNGALNVRYIWFGYAAALLEWQFIIPETQKEISDLCEPLDDALANEVFLGLPDREGKPILAQPPKTLYAMC